jgi:hypothetical protein
MGVSVTGGTLSVAVAGTGGSVSVGGIISEVAVAGSGGNVAVGSKGGKVGWTVSPRVGAAGAAWPPPTSDTGLGVDAAGPPQPASPSSRPAPSNQ